MSVKAAVLPFARFPGADPVLGPEMRSTGEVMASAADLPTAFAKAERAAGRPLPTGGTAFLSVRDADKDAIVPVAAGARRARLRAPRDRRHGGRARGGRARGRRRSRRATRSSTRSGPAAATSSSTRRRARGARRDGCAIREAALVARVPCITTLAGARLAVDAIANAREEIAHSLQERIEHETRAA